MISDRASPSELLDTAIRALGWSHGVLLPASKSPETAKSREHWRDKGDWLALAEEVGASRIFFVGDEPVVVLAEISEDYREEEKARQFFNRIWSMARPQFLFLARPGSLEAFQLTRPPVPSGGKLGEEGRLWAFANTIAEVQEKFRDFQRDRLETGAIYGDERFASGADRADRALVRDLREVRRRLVEGDTGTDTKIEKLEPEHAHTLIARALFVRYLEDREIIIPAYFRAVAEGDARWQALLAETPGRVLQEPELAGRLFFRVLRDKEFTYALFDKLAKDFNGDTLPVTPGEREKVTEEHLHLLQSLLMGDSVGPQQQLFLFAYRFDIVPIELISSIYEEFHTTQHGKGNTQGSHYTPPALAEYLLSQVLTKEILDRKPRVMDPACGSGIFLVESFRRMARHALIKKIESGEETARLSQDDLRAILAHQIVGIDINPEAVRIAAFSLSLAWLHYQTPRTIHENRRLPNLRWWPDREEHDPAQHLDILYEGNAFDAIQNSEARIVGRFGPGSVDVVVGNPPWGAVKKHDEIGRKAWAVAGKWCKLEKERSVGDKEQSQAFVHLALDLLREGGAAGMLLSSGVLFKQQDNSKKFRQSWLTRSRIKQVINFAHVRELYFSGKDRAGKGIAPFILATFEKGKPEEEHRLAYWSAKHTDIVGKTRAVVLATSDMHWLFQDEARRRDWLWKLYWWGNFRDENLVRTMQRFYSLDEIGKEREGAWIISGQGYKKDNETLNADWLSRYKELPVNYLRQYGKFSRYRRISDDEFVDVPDKVERRGPENIYRGQRLLFKQGIGGGILVSRLITSPCCFVSSIHAFRFHCLSEDDQKIVQAIFWSSLAKYYFWLTAGSWGMRNDQIHLHMIEKFPIALPEDPQLQTRIVDIVDELRGMDSGTLVLNQDEHIADLERQLDEAIFDLYVCGEASRDLIREMCDLGLDFFYKKGKSRAVLPVELPSLRRGVAADLPSEKRERKQGIEGYLQVFLRMWNADLLPDAEFGWQIMGDTASPILAVLFKLTALGETPEWEEDGDWRGVLARIAESARVPVDRFGSIYTDTFIRAVGEYEILIIKRNERRHWTRGVALNDADTTIFRAMAFQEEQAR